MTRVRNANALDMTELERLIPRSAGETFTWFGNGHLLVLDLGDGTLGAAVHIDVHDEHATLDLLVVDERLAGREIEQRMSGVAHALCVAYGCEHVETIAEPRRIAARGRR